MTEIRFAWPESSPGSSKIIQEEKFDHEENVVEDETKSGEKTNEEKKDREEEKNQEGEEKEMKVILETDIGTNDVTYMSGQFFSRISFNFFIIQSIQFFSSHLILSLFFSLSSSILSPSSSFFGRKKFFPLPATVITTTITKYQTN